MGIDVVRPESAAERPPCESPVNFIFVGCVVKELHADVTSNPVVEEFEFTEQRESEDSVVRPNRESEIQSAVRKAVELDEPVVF